MEKVKADIQLLDSFVQEYEIKLKNKISELEDVEMKCSVSFEIVNMENKGNEKIGQICMGYNVELLKDGNNLGKIHLLMQALFSGSEKLKDEDFEKMLKYNGAPVLSQIIRAYVITNTSLNGMPTIKLPMLNFFEYNKNAENNKKSIEK